MRPPALLLVAVAALAIGCIETRDPPAARTDTGPEPLFLEGEVEKAQGQLVGSKLVTFEVPEGATAVYLTLTWDGAAKLGLTLKAPDGSLEKGIEEKQGQVSLVTAATPVPGTWEARVTTSSEGKTPFSVRALIDDGPPDPVRIGDTVNVFRGKVVEANVVLERGAQVKWKYEATRSVEWDIHTHDPETGQVSTPAQGSGAANEGTFTAPTTGLYSFAYTAAEGDAAITYSIEGPLRAHSYPQS